MSKFQRYYKNVKMIPITPMSAFGLNTNPITFYMMKKVIIRIFRVTLFSISIWEDPKYGIFFSLTKLIVDIQTKFNIMEDSIKIFRFKKDQMWINYIFIPTIQEFKSVNRGFILSNFYDFIN